MEILGVLLRFFSSTKIGRETWHTTNAKNIYDMNYILRRKKTYPARKFIWQFWYLYKKKERILTKYSLYELWHLLENRGYIKELGQMMMHFFNTLIYYDIIETFLSQYPKARR